jgi:hypothetical protein
MDSIEGGFSASTAAGIGLSLYPVKKSNNRLKLSSGSKRVREQWSGWKGRQRPLRLFGAPTYRRSLTDPWAILSEADTGGLPTTCTASSS